MEKYIVKNYTFNDKDSTVKLLLNLHSTLRFKSYLFELGDVDKVNIDRIQKNCSGIALTKYMFTYTFEHMRAEWIPEEDTKYIFVSNLDDNWMYSNPNPCDRVSEAEFLALVNYFKKRSWDCSTIMLGINGIKWNENVSENEIESGTYGYEKAKSYFHHGEKYLSNSVIISKERFDKKVYATVSYQEKYKDATILNRTLQLLGNCHSEEVLYAPSNDEERVMWDNKAQIAKDKFNALMENLGGKYDGLPHSLKNEQNSDLFLQQNLQTINVKKLLKSTLVPCGWQIINEKDNRIIGIPLKKKKQESEITIYVDSTHKGHYLQLQILYKSTYFSFNDNINYSFFLKEESDVQHYVENICDIAEYIYERL